MRISAAVSLIGSGLLIASPVWGQSPAPSIATAPAIEKVEFNSASRPLGKLMEQRARARGEDPKPTPGEHLEGYLARPEGSGPFPAVVVLPGCAGLTPYVKEELPQQLASWGYVALVVDSWATRRIEPDCMKDPGSVDRVADSYGGFFYLATLPFADRTRVGVLGVADGARIVLTLVQPLPDDWVFNPDKLTFKAGVTYDPMCAEADAKATFPLLLLIGQRDQRYPARACEDLTRNPAVDSAPMELAVFPDAHHGFLEPKWGAGQDMFGYHVEYNREAAADSLQRTRDFLGRTLDTVSH
ncbi:dienelactone hydrolase family protein [Microvirga calopogonii]|uniref:dienelactone hydrolase family protein n=1 Tax=Microvirga calopogonii TaxID=2078013 RepID=UPI000E0DE682|nr:dienelactone hydrolase family protein [Microvirga calopogonii]